MKKLFKLQDEMVKFAEIGIQSETGFTGLQIVVQDGKHNEIYFADGEVLNSQGVGEIGELELQDIKGRFNAIRYNLLSEVRKTLARATVTHFKNGFTDGVVYFDEDLALMDEEIETEEVAIELIQEGQMYQNALSCAVEASNNFDYLGGGDSA